MYKKFNSAVFLITGWLSRFIAHVYRHCPEDCTCAAVGATQLCIYETVSVADQAILHAQIFDHQPNKF